jgi:hypothetical protein
MKKNVGFGLSGILLFISLNSFSQSYFDEALLFSRIGSTGSARIQAMGGAQVALGGDYSSAFSNPAGLGFFNKSEATFSLGTNSFNSKSNYFGNSLSDSRSNFNVPGFSVIFHSDKNKGNLISGNFAISLTRTNNFNQNFSYRGENSNNSMIDHFIEESNEANWGPSQFITYQPDFYINPYEYVKGLAYNNYLIGPNSETKSNGNNAIDTTTYHTYAQKAPSVLQEEKVKMSGAQNQVNFAYGLNFNDRFYLGAAIGLASFNYHAVSSYSEFFKSPSPLIDFGLTQDYTTKGSGINATLGIIGRPIDNILLGFSMTTPTYYYSVNNSLTCNMFSNWNNYTYMDSTAGKSSVLNGLSSTLGEVIGNYTLTTPWRLKAGATVFIQKHGLITAEIESINYSKAKYTSQTQYLDFSNNDANYGNYVNSDIKSYYRSVLNLRLGGEYRFKNYRARLGYSYMPDPYNTVQDGIDNSIMSYTAGLGYRSDKFFVDLGFSLTQWNAPYEPYYLNNQNFSVHGPIPVVKLQNSNTSVMATIGFTL